MDIKQNIEHIKSIIHKTELKPDSVLLLAVSKQQSVEAIRTAYDAGISDFGENYIQEALPKIEALKNLPIHWHFIGPIQSNKCKDIATHCSWVHSVNRIKVAKLLNDSRPETMPPLNICIQINIIEEDTKSGIAPSEAEELVLALNTMTHLRLKGLMTIPPPDLTTEEQYSVFMKLNKLMHTLNQQLKVPMDTLSMGMTDDLIPAIKAGATIVRIGRALFGERRGTHS